MLDKTKERVNQVKKGTVVHTAFSDYTIIKQVGAGGNGKVFSASNGDGKDVAIKFIDKNDSIAKRKRFKNEIHFCEHHNCKNIVTIIDRGYFDENGTEYIFYVMPLYHQTLRDKMKSGLAPHQAIDIFVGIIQGLNEAHKCGVFHRDIKPENILFAEGSNVPVICDFGIAHFSEDELLTTVETKKTDRLANFQYAAPEQRQRGGQVDGRADVYAAGLILNEMFTGEIVQAKGYTTIADIDPDYDYLDTLFDEISGQNPENRLYPGNKILTELQVLTQRKQNISEIARINATTINVKTPEEINLSLERVEFKNGQLVFHINETIPRGWFSILQNGSYSHTFIVGYGPQNLSMIDPLTMGMRLRTNESDSTIKTTVVNLRQWISVTNSIFNRELKQRAEAERRAEEQRRIEELKKLEEANRINDLLETL